MMLRRLWSRIHEPRVEKIVYLAVYLGAVALAVLSLIYPPPAFVEPLGGGITILWVWLWLVSAAAAAAVVLIGWWKAERIAIAVALLGIGIYTAAVVITHLTGGGPRFVEMFVLWIGAGFYAARLVRIWGPDFEPRP